MTRRLWTLAALLGLPTGLLPGCALLGTTHQMNAPETPAPRPAEQLAASAPSPQSPYHLLPPPTYPCSTSAGTDTASQEQPAEPASVEMPPASRAPAPEMPPYAEASGPPSVGGQRGAGPGEPAKPQAAQKNTEKEHPPESPLVAALRALLEKRPAEAMQLLAQHDEPNRELVQALLVLTAHAGQGSLDRVSPEELGALQEELQQALRKLKSQAPLVLDRLAFCRCIEDFGVYEPLPRDSVFQSGIDGQPGERVLVYGEVRNFGVQQHGSLYETALASTLEIRDFQNQVVARMDIPSSLNRSRSPRQDYYLRIRFHIPPRLPPGRYTLWVQIRDLSGGRDHVRVARRSLDLRIAAPAP
jgi:hypothetical protein